MKRLVSKLFSRSIVLYALALLIVCSIVDQEKADLRILNYLRDSAWYINRFAEEKVPFDRPKFVEAKEYYEKIVVVMPQLKMTYGMLGYVEYHLGNLKSSAEYYKKAIEQNPDFFGFHYNLGLIYLRQGKDEQAMEALRRITEIEPNHSLAYNQVVAEKRFKNDTERLAWVKLKTEEIKQGYGNVYKLIVEQFIKLERFDDAYVVAQGRLNSDQANQEYFHYHAGVAAYNLKQQNQAIFHLMESIKINQAYKPAYDYLEMIFKNIGNESLASAYKIKSKELDESGKASKIFDAKDISLFYYIPIFEIAR